MGFMDNAKKLAEQAPGRPANAKPDPFGQPR